MTPARLLLVLKTRWVTAVAVLAAVLALTAGVTALQPRLYTATAVVMVDYQSADPLGSAQVQPQLATGYLAAQVDILQSERLIRRVIEATGVADDPVERYRERWQAETRGEGDFLTWLSDRLRKQHLDVRPGKESGVISISYSASDREKAATLANAFVKAYIDTALQLRVEPARRNSSFFDERTRQLRDKLEAAQARLSEYQRANGLLAVASDERMDIESARLNELSTQLVQMQALAGESGSRQTQVRAAGDRAPEVLASPIVAGLTAELSRQEARLSEMATRLGDQHPSIVELRANVSQLRSQIASETRRVTASVGVNDAVNQSRIAQTRAALEAQRAKVLQIRSQRDEAQVLQREVQHAQTAYDALSTRTAQASLESQSNLSNINLLKSATAPALPSTGRFGANLTVAAVLGLVLGIAAAMFQELRNPRLRHADDVGDLLALPLLVEIPAAGRAAGGSAKAAGFWPRLQTGSGRATKG